jgi:hypothetical protein
MVQGGNDTRSSCLFNVLQAYGICRAKPPPRLLEFPFFCHEYWMLFLI